MAYQAANLDEARQLLDMTATVINSITDEIHTARGFAQPYVLENLKRALSFIDLRTSVPDDNFLCIVEHTAGNIGADELWMQASDGLGERLWKCVCLVSDEDGASGALNELKRFNAALKTMSAIGEGLEALAKAPVTMQGEAA